MRLDLDANGDDNLWGSRGSGSHWTPECIPSEVVQRLLFQEVLIAQGDHTKALHILPAWDKTRIGMIAYEEDIEKKFSIISKFWRKLQPFQKQLVLEKIDLQYCDLLPHIQEIFTEVKGSNGEAVDPLFNYLLRLCLEIQGGDNDKLNTLQNPISTDPKKHSKLGSRLINTQDALDDLIITARLHLPVAMHEEIRIASERAIHSYKGILRKNSEEFVVHPLEITTLLIKIGVKDANILIAALFHDLEDVTFCQFKPISKVWSDHLESYLSEILGDKIPQRRLKKISNFISLVSKPEVLEDGTDLSPSDKPKKIMHVRANMLHETRVIKAGDYYHNCLTSDVVKKPSLGNLIPRGPNDILPHLGIASTKENRLTTDQIKIEERLKHLILRQRPELFKLYSGQ